MGKKKVFVTQREFFLGKLRPVKNRLPSNYGVFYAKEFNENPRPKVYNVVNENTIDWDILEKLKKIVKKYGTKEGEKGE